MRIRTKLVAYFLIVALLAPIIGGAALSRLRSIDHSVQNLTENAIPRINNAQELASLQRDQQAAALSFVANGNVEARQRYLDLKPKFDDQLKALSQGGSDDTGKGIEKEITTARGNFDKAGAQLVTARTTSDRNLDNLKAKREQIVSELSSIRKRFLPSGQSGTDASGVPQAIRYQINDLLLATEGMLNMVSYEHAVANEYKVAPNDTLRQQFDAAGNTFTNWLQIANAAGGSEDRQILTRVQAAFGEFESSARAMMAASDLSTKSLATFTDASTNVQDSLNTYVSWQAGAMDQVRRESSSTVSDAQMVINVITIGGFVLAGALGFWLASTFTKPIRQLRDVAERVSTGDVENVDINVNTRDEIADLADAFRRMVASVRFLMMRGDDEEEEDDAFDFTRAS